MTEKNLLKKSLLLGTSLTLMGLVATPTQAFDLFYRGDGTGPGGIPFDPSTKIFEWQSRAGAAAPGGSDWEFGIGPAGFPGGGSPSGQISLDWVSGEVYNWNLTYNQTTGLSQFTLLNTAQTISYTLTNPTLLNQPWTQFGLVADIRGEEDKVEPITSFDIAVTQINGEAVNVIPLGIPTTDVSVTLTQPNTRVIAEKFFEATTIVNPITNMTGTIALTWDSLNPNTSAARSRVDFTFKAYEPGEEQIPPDPEDVPEPSTLISLFTLGALGLASRFQKKS